MISLTDDNTMLGYGLLNACPNISHFVTTRHGGCSQGRYGTFNCSPYTADEAECVCSNQQLLLERLHQPVAELIIPRQCHGTTCRMVDEQYGNMSADERKVFLEGVDALIAACRGYCICVTTADCVPVLLYDGRSQVVAAVHAGWRGTVRRIVSKVLEQMKCVYGTKGEDLIACIGPSISLRSFEVGEEVYGQFADEGFDMASISGGGAQTGKHHIDLWEANTRQLMDFGVPASRIEVAGVCTYRHHSDFFSARRLGVDSGRILSGIMLNES